MTAQPEVPEMFRKPKGEAVDQRVIDRSVSQVDEPTPLARMEPLAPAAAEPSVNAILLAAVEQKMDPAALEKLVALKERLDAAQAKREFSAAYAAFKAECPPVVRRTENTQFKVQANGVSRNRRYASLEDIADTIREPLGRHGLSYRWSDGAVADGWLTVSCVVSHVGGHSEPSSFKIPIDSKAGCSDQQKMGTAATYAQRYSLIQALGLTSCDEDDDGNAPPPTRISAHQADVIDSLLKETDSDRAKFLEWLGVSSLADIPVARHAEAIRKLESKRKAAR